MNYYEDTIKLVRVFIKVFYNFNEIVPLHFFNLCAGILKPFKVTRVCNSMILANGKVSLVCVGLSSGVNEL